MEKIVLNHRHHYQVQYTLHTYTYVEEARPTNGLESGSLWLS